MSLMRMPRGSALDEQRNREILTHVVRAYIETGEPVSSRAVARRQAEPLSPATVRNVMADLEEEGYLYQPHTSAGRVPTEAAYRFFVQQIAAQAELSAADREWIQRELAAASTPEEVMERASHVLATVSRGLGIVISPPLARSVLEHIRFLALPDHRVLVVLITRGGMARDKLIRVERPFTQDELDRTADYLNRHYAGWTLEAIRADLEAKLGHDRERYDRLYANALVLCDPKLLDVDPARQVYVEGTAQIVTAPEFADQEHLRALLAAIEERRRLVELLTSCIESPEPVHIQIGVKEINLAGEHLSLISAPYGQANQFQGSLGVLGPLRMEYERAITAVAYVARLFGESLKT
ncbi:MAG: heat-inducible transcriptional repressor HrcA [Acidobacteriia bacterium]|jgi:heat-inducible transcriptional repressor|nr:heat-inducible transcriptional repressor HrcA [Terriglobia bacterium]